MANGSRHSAYMVAETTYGTTPTNPALDKIRHMSITLGLAKNAVESEELRSDRQVADFRHGTRQVGGEVAVELSFGSFDDILEAVMCGSWVETGEVGVNDDVLKAGTTRRSFSVLRHFGDLTAGAKAYHLFKGVEFNTMKLSIAPNAMVKATFGCVGQDLALSTTAPSGATYPTPTTSSPMDSFSGVITEGGSAIAVVTEIELNLENGIEPRFVVGSQITARPSIARSRVSGQITAYFEDTTLLEKFINESNSTLEFSVTDGTNQYTFTLPNIKYTGGQPDVSGEGAITLAMPFQAIYDDATSTQLSITRGEV